MAAANLPIYVWYPQSPAKLNGEKQKNRKPLMHDKFCILGNKQVWTGSFNFTFAAATSNCENVIVLENANVASLYLEEFERLKKTGCMTYSEYMIQKK
jgi:phosphatidylserine/phosphatidylglycerophosphate/cardiolipin synthase-like enzyme